MTLSRGATTLIESSGDSNIIFCAMRCEKIGAVVGITIPVVFAGVIVCVGVLVAGPESLDEGRGVIIALALVAYVVTYLIVIGGLRRAKWIFIIRGEILTACFGAKRQSYSLKELIDIERGILYFWIKFSDGRKLLIPKIFRYSNELVDTILEREIRDGN
ncbi:hypothetical protein ACFL1X_09170 [Candidatus Hydrogenedentota bacterium]